MKANSRKISVKLVFVSLFAVSLVSELLAEQAWEQQVFTNQEAVDHLKSADQYDSLGEAFQMARYNVREVESDAPKVWAQNPEHDLSATFNSEGLHLHVRSGSEKLYKSIWRLESAGGNKVATGELRSDGQRVEIVRPGLTEWFVNRPTGLEHGFTLATRPAGVSEELRLTVAVEGDLVIAVSKDGQRAELQDKADGAKVLDYDKLRVWDATGRELPARMAATEGGAELQLEVDDADAHYPLTIDPTFTQQPILIASNGEAGDEFGGSVAISGDTAVIGAVGQDRSGALSFLDSEGAVYVFVREEEAWVQQAFLKASNAQRDDEFGISVAISEDTLVVGATGEDSFAGESGAAYVFVRDDTTWSQQALLKAEAPVTNEGFGASVGVSGDTLVVGAAEDFVGNTAPGSAYVFVREGESWSQQAVLQAGNAGADDLFGLSVGLSGDTIVVGARDEDSSAEGGDNDDLSDSGAAYVFVRDGIFWSQQAFLKADDPSSSDGFGNAVAISEETIVIGSPEEDSIVGNSGAGYIFVRSGTTWSQQALLKAEFPGVADQLGRSVAIFENRVILGTDAEDSSVAGGPENNSETSAGAAYVFERDDVTWSQVAFLKASNAEDSDSFGVSVGVSEVAVIVGAEGEDTRANESGAAYIFEEPVIPLGITEIEVDRSSNTVMLTWTSTPGETYRVDYSLDLTVWNEGLASEIPHDGAGGGVTSEEIDLQGTGLDGVARAFLRVVEE